MLGRLFRFVAGLFVALLNIGTQKNVRARRVRALTLKLEGLDSLSREWAARRWTTSIDGSTFVRACYLQEELPTERIALQKAARGFNRIKGRGRKLRYNVTLADPLETRCLADDSVYCYPPQVLIVKNNFVRPLEDHEVQMDPDHVHGTLMSA
ncbi:hypothetical protein HYV70_05440 [Candidatus Uhrbacteria bacterium]|nr:hypothetical protein [Candidatus Uhrbacteria bacterium]